MFLTKALLGSLLAVLALSSEVRFPLRAGQVGNRMVTVDSEGERLKLACVNWYGAHMEGHVVNGLDRQSIESIANTIVRLGFNCVRQCGPPRCR